MFIGGLFAAFAFILSSGVMAQAIPSTTSKLTYVLVTSSSGQRLSAAQLPPETLSLSPNSDGWEQWQYAQDSVGNRELWSFHGTKLLLKGSRAYHAPGFKFLESLRIEPISTTDTGSTAVLTSGLTSGGTVIICMKPDRSQCLTESAGRLVATALTDLTRIHAQAQWKLTLVNAASGRLDDQSPVSSGATYNLRSHHGDFVNALLPTTSTDNRTVVSVTHGASPSDPPAPVRGLNDLKTFTPLLFGDSITIVFRLSYLNPWVMKPGGTMTSDGLETVVAQTGTDSRWTIMPVAPFQNGMRIPKGAKVILKSSSSQNLSAASGIPGLRLSPNAGAWEQWSFVSQ